MKQPVLFIDRDGTLIAEPPDTYQVDSLEKLSFLPGVISALKQITQLAPYRLVIVTNQDGLGTSSFPEETFWPAHEKMLEIFRGEGIVFDEVIIDRTFKHEQAPTRKPGTGLLTHYLTGEYDLAGSFVIGDRPTDIQLAHNLGARGILIGRSVDTQDNDVDWTRLRDTLALETQDWTEIVAFFARQQGRTARITRDTLETQVRVSLNLDGTGITRHETGIGFLDHMLDQLGKHSRCDMAVSVKGDLHIDDHHTIEDTAIALGEAFRQALGDKRGIERYGCFTLVMDDALAEVAIDFSGRPWLIWEVAPMRETVGAFSTEMLMHFFKSFSDAARCNLRVRTTGHNTHHLIEATFKGVARAIRLAVSRIPGDQQLPTTKGLL
ncbi:MAG: bifunctional histidinol-phosphatase/imidazoleglycerol-phosphate dehydratase HisB [Bacteroidia bacterium]|nr:bifunctional histidinol-phosphatase/imidazoleglycerol-phosphate dehydratase HisB [Bacteroidia bacterium]